MSHVLKVIIGFTVMIAIGIGVLYYLDQKSSNSNVKANAGDIFDCGSMQDC